MLRKHITQLFQHYLTLTLAAYINTENLANTSRIRDLESLSPFLYSSRAPFGDAMSLRFTWMRVSYTNVVQYNWEEIILALWPYIIFLSQSTKIHLLVIALELLLYEKKAGAKVIPSTFPSSLKTLKNRRASEKLPSIAGCITANGYEF